MENCPYYLGIVIKCYNNLFCSLNEENIHKSSITYCLKVNELFECQMIYIDIDICTIY